jgi:hypothetical protein
MKISRQRFIGFRRVLDECFVPNAFLSENRAVYQLQDIQQERNQRIIHPIHINLFGV